MVPRHNPLNFAKQHPGPLRIVARAQRCGLWATGYSIDSSPDFHMVRRKPIWVDAEDGEAITEPKKPPFAGENPAHCIGSDLGSFLPLDSDVWVDIATRRTTPAEPFATFNF